MLCIKLRWLSSGEKFLTVC